MVTSPNWMAPFHIARATAGPRSVLRPGRRASGRDRLRMISRACNPTALCDRARMSTKDDESVQVDAAGRSDPKLDRVCAGRSPGGGEHDAPARAGRSPEVDGPAVDAVDIDGGTAARRADRRDDRDASAGERG